jgi:hypothetical protein
MPPPSGDERRQQRVEQLRRAVRVRSNDEYSSRGRRLSRVSVFINKACKSITAHTTTRNCKRAAAREVVKRYDDGRIYYTRQIYSLKDESLKNSH